MAKKRKTKTSAAKYIEKISAQISDIMKKDLEKSFKVMPSDTIKKVKKMLPNLKKQVEKKIREELKKSFRVMPSGGAKKRKRARRKK
jgi:long-subunit acyl-CoA synthetase (AMP-forming)